MLEDIINKSYTVRQHPASRIICKDGFSISVQAGPCIYCTPRFFTYTLEKSEMEILPYTTVELGFPSEKPTEDIMKYAEDPESPTESVYGYVPVDLVRKLIKYHGGEVGEQENTPINRLDFILFEMP
jgi:hypothetical protein